MMHIKLLASDPYTLFRKKRIELQRGTIETPVRVYYEPRSHQPPAGVRVNVQGVIELYVRIAQENLRFDVEGFLWKRHEELRARLPLIHDISGERPVFIMSTLDPTGLAALKPRVLGQVVEGTLGLQEELADVYVMPGIRWSGDLKDPNQIASIEGMLRKMADLLKETVHSYRKKPLLLSIPLAMEVNHLSSLLTYYAPYADGLVLDFARRTPATLSVNAAHVIRELGDRVDSMIVYGANVNPGGYSRKSRAVEAKDILSVGLGIDIIGINHYGIPFTNEKKLSIESKVRFLDRREYFYISDIGEDFISGIRTSIPRNELVGDPKRFQNLFNYEQVNLELNHLGGIVENGEGLLEYWKEKSGVRNHLDCIRRARSYISVEKLDGTILIEDY